MRVTNTMLVDGAIAAMQQALARIGISQARMATGRQLQRPAEDPAGHAAATRIQARVAASEQFKRQAQQAESTLVATDRSLGQLHELLTRASELAVTGANDSNNATDRAAIAAEVNALLEESVTVANVVEDGRSLFGGRETRTPPLTVTRNASGAITAATWNPRGVDGAVTVAIDEGLDVQVNVGGTAVFGASTDTTFVPALLVRLRDALAANDGGAIRATIDQLTTAQARLADPSAAVGGRLDFVQETLTTLDDKTTAARAALSAILDADVGRVATELAQQQLVYQASLAAAARAIQPSLLEFLR
jgi:flagellar hook-associated protein 3 FlgL